ncbi:MAG: glycosyltransferase [Balneolaceae bacterium]|nr:glycosyltransferase [Balneolaceae bacterium]
MLVKLIKTSSPCCLHSVVSLNGRGEQSDKLEKLGVKVFHLRKSIKSIPLFTKLIIHLFKQKPNVCQGWMYHGNLFGSLMRLLLPKCKLVWNIRHSLYDISSEKPLTQTAIKISRSISNKTDLIIYNSHKSLEQHEDFGFAKKSEVLPNGFDMDRFIASKERFGIIRKELEIDSDSLLITQVGRNHPMKDHLTFLKAAKHTIETKKDLNFHFLMVLRNKDKDPAIRKFINKNDMWNYVTLCDGRSDIENIWAASDVGVLTSAWGEAFPNVIGEAMACETPFVSTDVGDAKLIIGDCGSVVTKGDFKEISEAISKILEMKPEDRKVLGEKARERIYNLYSIDKVTENYLKTFSRILENESS